MKTRIGLVACALTAVSLAAACTGGGDGGGGGINLRAGDFGGFVLVAAGAPGAAGSAVFYSGMTSGDPNETLSIEFETDECLPPEISTGTAGEPVFSYLDVGDFLTFTSGALTWDAAKDTSSGITYSGFQTTTPGATNADYTVTNSGSATVAAGTITTVHVPNALVFAGTGDITTPNQPIDITWTGAEGANFVSIDVSNSAGDTVYECAPKNDGSFTLPAVVTSAAGMNGTFDISAVHYGTDSFNGKTIVTVGFPL